MKDILKNISYSFGVNVFSLCISAFMVIIVPKFLTVDEYGMWQLFLFYSSYLGFLHFGWEDGIYLRYAGEKFEELDAKLFSGQFYGIIILQFITMIIVIVFAMIFVDDFIKRNVLLCAISLTVFVNFNNCCNFIMQITNRIKDYAKLIFTERAIFSGLVVLFICLGFNHFYNLYMAQLFSSFCLFIVSFYTCRRLLHFNFYPIRVIIDEAISNIEVGIKLMIANIAGMLIIGIIRYGISMGWDISTFGKVSLTLNISNFFMVFITSVSIVIFPMLKHIEDNRLPLIYMKIRNILTIVLFLLLIAYYPLKELLTWWLPQYADSLVYMSILFPVCLFQSKVNLLINTYLKSLRKENLMLKINLISVMLAVIVTFITVGLFHNLQAAVFSIIFLYAFQCELAEYYMEKLLHIKLRREIIEELFVVGIFIITGVLLDSWWCMVTYGMTYIGYLILHRDKIRELRMQMRRL